MIGFIANRIRDYLRERRIATLKYVLTNSEGMSHAEFCELWDQLRDEINARSPEQVARMERNRGLR